MLLHQKCCFLCSVVGRKRKPDGSSSSQSSDELHPSKKRRSSDVRFLIVWSAWILTGTRAISPVHIILWHLLLLQKASVKTDEEDGGPSWEAQESMVRKLQKKFPDQDKEVRWDALPVSPSSNHFTLLLSSPIYR